ncbi:cytochrome P450 [Streptomyces sp. PT12]|uniref:cytochrome P450 n=1 Tax=Streptomyces sp. PT12 TaxID=1510197 RepID=UPI00215CA005|nr:cytochrome P450 [Streptomyces sp. PT12]
MATEATVTPGRADQALMGILIPPHPIDPFPLYETLQSENRVHHSAVMNIWALSGHEEVTEFLKRPGVQSGARASALRHENWAEHASLRLYLNSMVALNQPDHGRVRVLASRVFTPSKIKKMQPAVERLTRGLVDDLIERSSGGEPVDLVEVLATPFPVAVICDMLGIPFADGERLWELADDWSRVFPGAFSDEDLARADDAAEQLGGYFADAIKDRRAQPREDLLTSLVQEASGGHLDDDELVALVLFLFTAGFSATTNLIAAGTAALIEHPDELNRWREDKSITQSAVDELLRHSAHNTASSRVTVKPVTVGDAEIPEGELVVCLLAAANRDPRRFPEPHRLKLTRDDGPHLSFSAGSHYCFGGTLARMEGAELFTTLIDTFPKIELASEPERRGVMGLTSYATLPLTLGR